MALPETWNSNITVNSTWHCPSSQMAQDESKDITPATATPVTFQPSTQNYNKVSPGMESETIEDHQFLNMPPARPNTPTLQAPKQDLYVSSYPNDSPHWIFFNPQSAIQRNLVNLDYTVWLQDQLVKSQNSQIALLELWKTQSSNLTPRRVMAVKPQLSHKVHPYQNNILHQQWLQHHSEQQKDEKFAEYLYHQQNHTAKWAPNYKTYNKYCREYP